MDDLSEKGQAKVVKEKGSILFKEGKVKEALEQFEVASTLDPTCAVYWSNQALCCLKLNRYEKLKIAAEKAIGCDETFSKGYYYLAKAQKESKELSEALATLELGESRCATTTEEYHIFRDEVKADLQEKMDEEELKELSKCQNCGKLNAPQLCSRCNFACYCNRECQKNHWKIHKPKCIEGDILDKSSCQNCSKVLNKGRVCAKCKKFSYCSMECQQQHWPEHKATCRKNRHAMAEISQLPTESRRLQKLFEIWKHRAQVFIHVLVTYGMTKEEFRMQPPRFVVWIPTEFNYNYMTFLPAANPKKIDIKDLPDDLKNHNLRTQIESALANLPSREETGYNNFNHVALLTPSGTDACRQVSIKPLACASTVFRRFTIKEVQTFMKSEITLNKEKLAQWAPLLNQNLKSQITNFKQRAGSNFTSFLIGAFRIYSKKPQNLSHVIQITFELGPQLGSVASFQSYKLITLKKARDGVSNLHLTEQAKQEYLTRLDVENSPRLLQSRIARPRNMLLPIIYVGHESNVHFVEHTFYEREQIPPMNYKKCEKMAGEMFQKLQLIAKSLPPVTSPDL